ncbi:MAG TPA: YfhO family protein [archaeon]|nr:YfhO family protein [archaeon]
MARKKKKEKPAKEKTAVPVDQTRYKLPPWLDKPYRFELALACFLLLALVVYFWDFISQPGSMIFGSDMATQGFQTRKIAVDAVKAGKFFPLWNPDSYCGIPYLGGLPGPLFFPTSLLYYVMPLGRALGYSALLMMLAGGLFTYLWIRELGLGKAAAALCGVAYSFTGWVASTFQGGHDGRMFTILLTPLVFFFCERAFKRRKPVYFLLMGTAVTLQILSPHIQMMYFSCLALSAYFLFRMALSFREKASFKELVKLAAGFILGIVFAVTLSSIQFAPTYANQKFSHRQTGTGLGYEGLKHATQYSMHPLETVGLIVPGFSGEPYSYWSASSSKGHSEYMGLLPLLFAAVVLACRRNRYTWFFASLGLLALFYNFGGFTPFFKLPYYLVPKVRDFRGPNMMFFVFAFSLVTLAGYGLDTLFAARDRKGDDSKVDEKKVFLVLSASVGAVLLLWIVLAAGKSGLPSLFSSLLPEGIGQARMPNLLRYYPSIEKSAFISFLVAGGIVGLVYLWRKGLLPLAALAGLLAVLTFGDLLRMDRYWLSVFDPAQYSQPDKMQFYQRDQMVDYLEKDRSFYRVFLYPTPGGNDPWDNSLLYFKIPAINASMPLRLRWYEELMGTFTFDNFIRYPRLWDMLNTKYVYFYFRKIQLPPQSGQQQPGYIRPSQLQSHFERFFPFLRRVLVIELPKSYGYSADDESPEKVLYENPGAWPRFKLFTRFEIIKDDKKFMERFNDQAFDPTATLILSEDPEFDTSSFTGGQAQGKIEILSYLNEQVELSVQTDQPALLYAAETYHPYWQAAVDGDPAKIYRANLAMRAVFLEPGEHKVVMRYHSRPYLWGKWLSLVSLLVLAFALGWTSYRKEW